MRLLFIFLFSSIALSFVSAQTWCGNTPENRSWDRFEKNKSVMDLHRQKSATVYVPVTFHLVANAQGDNRVKEINVLRSLCFLNEVYAEYEFQFFMKDGFNYVQHNTIHNNPGDAEFAMKQRRDNEALDIWCVGDIPGSQNGTTLGYYDPQNDWVVMLNSELGGTNKSFPHELGHFFSLAHTFLGWECEPWNEESHGNPVNVFEAPCGGGIERVNGVNCNTTADRLCDTEANYLFGLGWQGCNWTGEVFDANNDQLIPQEENYMSYFLNCNVNDFTPDQLAIMNADYNSSDRDYLREVDPTNLNVITDDFEPIYPLSDEVTETGDVVTLEWEALDNADSYWVEIDIIPSFQFQVQRQLVSSTTATFTLDIDKTYYWRATPYNQYSTCHGPSSATKFVVGLATATENPTKVGELNVRPNPISGNEAISFTLDTEEEIISKEIYDLAGKLVYSGLDQNQTIQFSPESSGIFILQITTPNHRYVEKLVYN